MLGQGLPGMSCNTTCPSPVSTPCGHIRLLIGVVSSSAWWSRMTVMENMVALDSQVHQRWVVSLYDGRVGQWQNEVKMAQRLGVPFDLIENTEECDFCPKLQFQLKFLDFLKDADYVWLPDADISFRDFHFQKFWQAHKAAGSPLIAQPAIAPATQAPRFCLNWDQWQCSGVVRVTYVEQQAPVMDAQFFKWMMPQLHDLAEEQRKLGASWGHCNIWCGAALAFRTDFHVQRPVCALVLEPIEHRDMRTINKTKSFFSVSHHIRNLLAHGLLFEETHPVSRFVFFQDRLLRSTALYDVQNTNMWLSTGASHQSVSR